ncbi:MAG: hypothetical protein KDH96_05925, partial [Candidatus Riesia sp.]|nr:hypothetical protein [Candidatus Riesia sp.]
QDLTGWLMSTYKLVVQTDTIYCFAFKIGQIELHFKKGVIFRRDNIDYPYSDSVKDINDVIIIFEKIKKKFI